MESKLLYGDLTYAIIGAAMEVHRVLGQGFWEYVYEEALCYELASQKIPYERQMELDIYYLNFAPQLAEYAISAAPKIFLI